jgi:hypothetical protein
LSSQGGKHHVNLGQCAASTPKVNVNLTVEPRRDDLDWPYPNSPQQPLKITAILIGIADLLDSDF